MSQYPSHGRPGLRISVILFLLVFWGALLFSGARNVQEAQTLQRFRRDQLFRSTHLSAQEGARQVGRWLSGLPSQVEGSLLRGGTFPQEVEAVWIWSKNLEGPPEQGIFPGVGLKPLSPDLESQVREHLQREPSTHSFWTEAGLILSSTLASGQRLAFLVGPAASILKPASGIHFSLVDPLGKIREHSLKNMDGSRVELQGARVRALRTLEGKEAIEALQAVPGYPVIYRSEALVRPVYRQVLGWKDFFASIAFGLSSLAFLNLGRGILRSFRTSRRLIVRNHLRADPPLDPLITIASIRPQEPAPVMQEALKLLMSQATERDAQRDLGEKLVQALSSPAGIREALQKGTGKIRSPFLHLVWSRESQTLELNFQSGLIPALTSRGLSIPFSVESFDQMIGRSPDEQSLFLAEYRPLARELLSRLGAVPFVVWPFPEVRPSSEGMGWLILLQPELDSGLNRTRLLEMLGITEIEDAQDPRREIAPDHPTEPPAPRGE